MATLAVSAVPWRRLYAAQDLPAVSRTGAAITLPAASIADLRARLRGGLLLASDAGFDAARSIWNGYFDRRPALIAHCAGAADVMRAVEFAANHDLLVSVRGGGHSISGQSVCEGGLMISLAGMRGIRVDPEARIARVEPGALLGEFDREAQAFGLVTPAGTVSHTGVAGLTLGGGFGRLARKFGLACDNLLSADVVTADGRLVRASATEHPELFWALRGGGGNFGIVTSFEYRLHASAPILLGGPLIFPFDQAQGVLRAYADYYMTAGDDFYADALLMTLPDGQRALVLDTCYGGSIEAGEKALAPLRSFGKPMQDAIAPTPYVVLQTSSDQALAPGRRYYLKAGFVREAPRDMTDALVAEFASLPPAVIMIFACAGGAISRVSRTATAFWHRPARWNVVSATVWDNRADDEGNIAAGRRAYATVEPWVKGFYVNDANLAEQSQAIVDSNYGGNHARLVKVKTQYDPKNLFHLNANVRPEGA
ncbi:MAG: FAD-binding oxidoreductase [Steroidobacteraceae bacterium]